MAPKPDLDPRSITRAETLASELAGFSARAGHDLLGPLSQAGALLTLFVQRYENHPDPQAQFLLDFLQAAASKMQSVVAGIQPYLDIAAAAPSFRETDMNAALASSQQRLGRAIEENSAEILADSLPVVSADGDLMASVFEVLLDNAIKFRREEPPRIEISSNRSGGHWLFRAEDNGIGIDEEHREAVFLPFRRLNGKGYAGAGMGLSTAKLIIGVHGGRIWIESARVPNGTAVLFTLPASD